MAIKVDNLSFSYNKDFVFKNISFEIEDGDFVAVTGPNGAGKTTLMKILLGLLKIQKGSIKLFGKDMNKFNQNHKISYVPQRFSIEKNFPGTVEEIFSLRYKDKNKKEEKILKEINIENLLNKKFSDLSGGQQQRILIAFALLSNPKLLILDEPTVGIDPKTQRDFYQMLKRLNVEKKMTVLLVTHDVGIIPSCAKKVLCINHSICCLGHAKDTEKLLKQIYEEDFRIHHHHY